MAKNIHFGDAIKINKVPEAFSIMAKPAGSLCNLNCTYCYYLEKKKLYPQNNLFMSDRILETFIQNYINEQQADTVSFTWQGGEPSLTGLSFFKKALDFQKKYAGRKTVQNSFQTNGTLLNEEWCRFFADNHFLVGISIDGPEEIHDYYRKNSSGNGSFRQVMKSIESFHRYHVDFNTLSVVNRFNAKHPQKIYRFLKDIQSRFIQFIPVVERIAKNQNGLQLVLPGHQEAEITEWSVLPKDYGFFLISVFNEWVKSDVGKLFVQIFDVTLENWIGAPAGLCVLAETCGLAAVMEHNGDVYSCDHFVYPEYFLGNIEEKPLTDMFSSDRQFSFGLEKKTSLPAYCRRCEYLFACHGECPKHRFNTTPDGEKGLNYLCPAYKLFFKHVTPYMDFMVNELKQKKAPANIMAYLRDKESENQRIKSPGRNDPCTCGSGKKFKQCCGKNHPI